jgi:catalase
MASYVDDTGENPHVNYEPSALGGLREAPTPYAPMISGKLTRRTLSHFCKCDEDYGQRAAEGLQLHIGEIAAQHAVRS